jgi:hypothetical protein
MLYGITKEKKYIFVMSMVTQKTDIMTTKTSQTLENQLVKLTKTMFLSQTNLEINTEKVFFSNEMEFFKTTNNQGFVLKSDFTNNGRNCFVFGKRIHSFLYKSMIQVNA